MHVFRVIAGFMFVAVPALASAADLTYTPVNPNFGGSPLNGSFLLNEAAANNNRYLTNPAIARQQAAATSKTTAGQQVIQELQQAAVNAVLSQVAAQISQGLKNNPSGTYTIGGEVISFTTVNGTINLSITDAATGGVTTIQIPVPTF